MVLNVRQETRRRGWSQTLRLGAITAGARLQYDRDNASLKAGRRQYGAFNTVNIINQSTVTVMFLPDFVEDRAIIIPQNTIISKDEITFQEFEIRNLDASTGVNANEITLTFGYEPPLKRDRDTPLSGGRRY